MENKVRRFIKIYPWYWGMVGDLLFYIAIDSLFLEMVKHLTTSQIVSLTTVSTVSIIVLQFPILFVIRKIGNTASVRIGAFLLLMSAVLMTVGKSYFVIALSRVLHDMAATFRNVCTAALENNLDAVGWSDKFVGVRAKGNTVYSFITMMIAFVASLMFNLDNYLPMIGCITTCTIGFILSFFIVDYTKYNRITVKKEKRTGKINYSGLALLAIIVFGLFYPIVTSGQTDGKLFIQQNLNASLTKEATAMYIGIIVIISRIVRVVSNMFFVGMYKRYRSKTGILLTVLLGMSISLLLFGSFVPPLFLRITLMAFGYIIILFLRDPFKLYIQDVVFETTPKEQHQTLITVMEFAVKIGSAGTSFIFAMVLLNNPMWVVMAMTLAISLIEILLSLKLYKMIMHAKKERLN